MNGYPMYTLMSKNKRLNLRISEARLNKLREYAAAKDKTMTQVVSDSIDKLRVNKDSLREF